MTRLLSIRLLEKEAVWTDNTASRISRVCLLRKKKTNAVTWHIGGLCGVAVDGQWLKDRHLQREGLWPQKTTGQNERGCSL